eukprot:XP_017175917.1 PREDICTED: CUB and Sushi multiple domains 2, opposite strand isoform X1 [Mus musculus]
MEKKQQGTPHGLDEAQLCSMGVKVMGRKLSDDPKDVCISSSVHGSAAAQEVPRSWVHSDGRSIDLLEAVPRSVGTATPSPRHLASSTGLISENKHSGFPEAKQAFDFYELRLLCRSVVLCLTVIASYKVTNK